MKIKELKHNHSLTDLLKVLLFSILMLLPFLAVGTRCLYVICNKNAYQSYSGTNTLTYYEKNTIHYESHQNLTIGDAYLFDDINNQYLYSNINNNLSYNSLYLKCLSENCYLNITDEGLNQWGSDVRIYGFDTIYFESDGAWYVEIGNNETDTSYSFNDNSDVFFSFGGIYELLGMDTLANEDEQFEYLPNGYNIYEYEEKHLISQNLDNVFDYSMDQMASDPLFNWTQNTAIYTGVNAMCTGMEITSPIIPILITYWFLLTCIYVIIDILIKGFTMLTHMIGSKMA